jgi:hypothetical protein
MFFSFKRKQTIHHREHGDHRESLQKFQILKAKYPNNSPKQNPKIADQGTWEFGEKNHGIDRIWDLVILKTLRSL